MICEGRAYNKNRLLIGFKKKRLRPEINFFIYLMMLARLYIIDILSDAVKEPDNFYSGIPVYIREVC